jgi:hypothetical protein
MAITIRFVDGARADTQLSVDDVDQGIRFGRDPEQCQVVFGPDETKVSRVHCELRRTLDGYELRRNLERKMLLNGKPVLEGARIKAGQRLTFGEGGPTIEVLEISLPKNQDLGATEASRGAPDKALVDVVERTSADMTTTRKELRETGKRVSNLGARLRKVAAAVVVLGAGSGLGYWHSQRGIDAHEERLAALGQQVVETQRSTKNSLQPMMHKVRDSVFLVVLRHSNNAAGAVEAVATAWTVAPGKVATNGHVADMQANLTEGQSLVLRNSRLGARELRIKDVILHPGYTRFPELMENRRVANPAEAGALMSGQTILACDVAIMDVVEADTALLGAALELADDQHIQGLKAGTPLGFVGHPFEGFVHGGVSLLAPVPTAQQGIVTAITGFLLEEAPKDESLLVHFNMPAAGGASGSPVFDDSGKIVAVLSAGNNYMLPPSLLAVMDPTEASSVPRIPVGGVNYGQSATMVRELLNGEAEERTKMREVYWNEQLDKVAALGSGRTLQALVDQIQVKTSCKLTLSKSLQGQLTSNGDTLTTHADQNYTLPADGEYLLITVPDSMVDIDAILSTTKGVLNADQDLTPYPIVQCKGKRGGRLTLRIETAQLAKGDSLKFTTYLFQRVQS